LFAYDAAAWITKRDVDTFLARQRVRYIVVNISFSCCKSAPCWLALSCMGVRVCLTQLRSCAGYLERVSAGETLEIIRRGRLVAFMVPPSPSSREPPKVVDRIALTHLRKNAAPYLDRVAAGEIIGVVHRGVLVARIVAAASTP
jgi:antitoxin (DNA-binding transcriptional repressor) of toxin-antitoxin stability system